MQIAVRKLQINGVSVTHVRKKCGTTAEHLFRTLRNKLISH
jgi:hypothetical protein